METPDHGEQIFIFKKTLVYAQLAIIYSTCKATLNTDLQYAFALYF